MPIRIGQRNRTYYLNRWSSLDRERSSWIDHWKQLGDYLLPRRMEFQTSDSRQGTRRNDKIINNTPSRMLRTMASGLFAGASSPARPWFRMSVHDARLAKLRPVKAWLKDVTELMFEFFARSNVYNALAEVYQDLGGFGTSVMYLEDDAEDVLRAYVFPIGSYCLATDGKQRVSTLYRKVALTIEQIVDRFGERDAEGNIIREAESLRKNMSDRIVTAYLTNKELDQPVEILHVIEPNPAPIPGRLDWKGMAWVSTWLEVGGDQHEKVLGKFGFNEFPCMAPRWEVRGVDVYGHSPGMEALGDSKALQRLERRKLQALDKVVQPPMAAPASMRTKRASILPGDMTFVDQTGAGQKFEAAHTVNPKAVMIRDVIKEHESRVSSTFYADLFLMLAASPRQRTAREVDELHEEKLLQLGPPMERLEDELFGPLIDRAFAILERRGLIPQPPEQLEGVELKVEFISVLNQAQKILGTVAVERLFAFVANAATMDETALDKLDIDKSIDRYADLLGTQPELLRPDDQVAAKRQERAKMQELMQAQAAAQAAAPAASSVKDLAQTQTPSGESGLATLLDAMGGRAA